MAIEFVSGDLFLNSHSVEAFAHGCNCQGSMGAGIAKGFRERYPEKTRDQADAEEIRSIAVPRIGVGYGGLSWSKVKVIVQRVFNDWPGRLIVYEEYVAEK